MAATGLADVVVEVDVELETVVGPRAELELARLDVERELGDVDGAGAAEQRRRYPQHRAVALYHRHRVAVVLEPHVRAPSHTHNPIIISPFSDT